MYLESDLVLNNQIQLETFLYDAIQVLFGVRPSNLNSTLLDSLFIAITDRFINITILDVQNSFRYAQIEKKQYVSLTRDEILQPINDYWFKKGQVSAKINEFDNRSFEEVEELNKQKAFLQEAKELYLKSLSERKFYLSEGHCSVIGKRFGIYLNDVRRSEIVKEAKEERVKRLNEEKIIGYSIVPNWHWIFARIWIEECLNNGKQWIEE